MQLTRGEIAVLVSLIENQRHHIADERYRYQIGGNFDMFKGWRESEDAVLHGLLDKLGNEDRRIVLLWGGEVER